jgi:nucleotide-binding universal stress UspA family protein
MTTSLAPIVVGVDGSSSSLHAVDWAAREASARGCPLRIVHAFLWPLYNVPLGPVPGGPLDTGLRAAAERILSAAAERTRRAAPAVDVSTDLPVCAPAAALIDASQDAALVVVGHRGLGGFTGLLLGSVGVQTAAHAACPVIVVRDGGRTGDPGDPGDPGPAAGHVVVGVDGSDTSGLAVEYAFAHAALHRLGVIAVHIYQMPRFAASSDPRLVTDVDGLREAQTRLLTDALAGSRDKYPDVPVRQKVVPGAPADVLIAESAGAALTVVGSRGRGGFTGLLLGSTSQNVLYHAPGPVAIVRAHTTRQRPASGVSQHDVPRAPVTTRPAATERGLTRPSADGETGADSVDAGAPAVSSFAKSLFTGRLPAAMVMPYPRLSAGEQHHVDTLIADARDFLDTTYDPVTVERQRWVGDDIIHGLGERGLLGLYVAPEYGGQGLSQTGYCRVMEEFGGYDASLSVVMGVHQSIGM